MGLKSPYKEQSLANGETEKENTLGILALPTLILPSRLVNKILWSEDRGGETRN